MEVPMSWRPRLKALVKSITGPISAFLIGFLVSLFLLPCTSGPYIVILGMLGHNETYLRAVLLLVLYNIIFVLPMVGITIGVYFGMDVVKAEETRTKNLRILHLIAGIIMLGMGIVLVSGIF
jgi:cytochrome c biogenesis protein CcdA